MARNLKNLIIASGYAGVAGQSFRNHVTGSGTGTAMSDYNMGSPTWSNAFTQLLSGAPYPTPYTKTDLTLTLGLFNSKAYTIQSKNLSNWTLSVISPGGTASGSLNSISWASNVATLNLTLFGELTTGTPTTAVSVWYNPASYPSGWLNYAPYLPYGYDGNTTATGTSCDPDCTTSYNVTFTFTVNGVGASGSADSEIYLSYAPDNYSAGYNASIYGPGPTGGSSWSITQNRRDGNTPVVTAIEWATDSGFTNVVSTSTTYTISSDNNTTATVYLRYKLDGAGSWTESPSNPINWQDPRDDF